jgi:hypothetical protein
MPPEDFKGTNPPAVSACLSLPGPWNGVKLNGKELWVQGYATSGCPFISTFWIPA